MDLNVNEQKKSSMKFSLEMARIASLERIAVTGEETKNSYKTCTPRREVISI